MTTENATTNRVEQTISQFIDAGMGLALLPFSLVQKSFESTKEQTQAKFSALQSRGEGIEQQLKHMLNVNGLCDQVLSKLSPKAKREAKLEVLSGKVDALVEQVAKLAAQKAAEKKADVKTVTRKRATTKTTSTATKPTTRRKAPVKKAASKTPE